MHCFILLLSVAAIAGTHTLNSDELEVRVDTSAPRILEYIRKDNDGRIHGSLKQGEWSVEILRRSDGHRSVIGWRDLKPEVDLRDDQIAWRCTALMEDEVAVTFEIAITVEGETVEITTHNIQEMSGYDLVSFRFPNDPIIRVTAGMPNAKICTGNLSGSGDLVPAGSPVPEQFDFGLVTTDKAAAGIYCNVISRPLRGASQGEDSGVWCADFRYSFKDENYEPFYCKIGIVADRNGDGQIDWQDAACAIHDFIPNRVNLRMDDLSEPRISSNGRFSPIGDGAALQRLKVDPEGRFIIRDDGTPFFWLGDTAWFIMRLTDDEIRYYLSNRVEKGFTGIQVDLNPHAWTNLMASGECENPFLNDNIDTPNESYWQRADWMVDEVARHGLYVLLTPMWGKHYPRYVGDDTAKAYDLGKWLGSRYRDRTHVMWFVSGEYDSINGYRPITGAQKALLNAVAQGLEDGHKGNQLMTIHPGARRTSSVDFHNETWLDLNMLQSGHFDDAEKWGSPETYTLITNDYNRKPAKPVFEGEPAYEDMIDGYFRGPKDGSGIRMGADVMRRKAYWSVFSGGFGHTYGHSDVQIFWSLGKPREVANRNHWRDALEAPGAGQMRHLRSLIESRSLVKRIPDQTVLASDAGSGKDHARATRASDGSYAMVYIPTGREVTVEMGKISSAKAQASWFDPRTGTYTAIGDYPNNGTQVFDPPGAATIGNDWVLVLDAEAASSKIERGDQSK